MAGIKITDLPAAPSALLTDVFPVDQLPGPVTYKESNSQLLSLFQANGLALTKTDDTNVTMTLAGNPNIALLNATSITMGWTGTLLGTRGGTGINNGSSTITLGGSLTTSGAFVSTFTMTNTTNVTFPTSGTLATTAGTVSSVSGTLNRITSTGGTTPVIDISASYVGQSSITTLGTVGTGVWQGTVIGGTYGGTGVNNGASTITLGGSLTTSGAFASTFTMTGITTVTFPTSGTLATTAGTVSSVSGTTNRITSTGGTTPVIDISASYVGQSSITTLGTITTGIWTGTNIALANGGSQASLIASNGGIVYSTASAMAILAGTATARQMLQSAANTTPAWSTTTWPATTTINRILFSSAASVIGEITTGNNGLLVTSSTGVPSILAGPGTTGNILQSNAAAAPSFSTATYPAVATSAGTILRADGTNWVASTTTYPNTNAINTLLYASSANVMAALATANSAVLVTNSSGVPAWSGTMTNGQLIIGSTTATPTAATLSAGSGITVTNGAGTITIAATGGGLAQVNQNSSSVTMAVQTNYTINNGASLVTLTLNATAAVGDEFVITGQSSGGWKVAQASGQTIHIVGLATTTGVGGSLQSTNQYDTVTIRCIVANTTFSVVDMMSAGLTIV